MGSKRVLLMHITNVTGHRSASRAIEHALREKDETVQIRNIDAFNYSNPYLLKVIYSLYIFIIKFLPKLWDYFYDNEIIWRKTRRIRSLIHRLNDKRIKCLLADFAPDAVVCTQAFPCTIVGDYKRRHNLEIPLIGVLTDFAAHIYWLNDYVDIYVLPAAEVGQRLLERGIAQKRQQALGIPIDTKFTKEDNPQSIYHRLGLDTHLPVILVMGGGQGLGPIKKIVYTLDSLSRPVQLIVVCGTNRHLYNWLNQHKSSFNRPLSIIGYTEHVDDLMTISSFVVTKAGGLTCAEALSKSLPIIIVQPLPGQESRNTRFLLNTGAALKARSLGELKSLAEELLSNSARLAELRKMASQQATVDSAQRTAQLILNTIQKEKG